MKLATTTGDFQAYTKLQEESMQYIREAGFQYLDYNFHMDYMNQSGIYTADWRKYLDNVKRLADSMSVQFIQAHSPMGSPIVNDAAHDAFVADTKRCIDSCAILGIRNLVVHSGYDRGLSKEECFEKNKLFYMDLLKYAEAFGVNILVENFNKMCIDDIYWIDSAEDQRELIDYVNHPLFHACWDTGHGNMQDMSQDESLKILGEHVYALHVQDNLGDTDSHVAPLFGSLNLDSLMHGLLDIGYNGYFTFEACNIFLPKRARRPFPKDERLLRAPLDLRIKAENLLYEIGKCTLEAYDCFEI